MRFVGILAIERECNPQKTPIFKAFCRFPLPPGRSQGKNPAAQQGFIQKNCHVCVSQSVPGRAVGRQKTMRLSHRIGISAAAFVASSAAAFAAPALTLSDLNMRAGPGTNSPVVITVPGGSTVDVFGCDPSGWCSVRAIFFAAVFRQMHATRAFP
jgi:Bacterial SH3 domain